MKLPIYLDHNATTPCDPRVVQAMMPYFTEHFGNAASRNHSFGWQAAEAVQIAREQVAALINADPGEIIFTSGATEADNLAIKGVMETYASRGNHIITSNIEHKAVLDACRHLEKQGAAVSYLPVNNEGLVTAAQVEAAIRPDTVLIAIMYANNEMGTLMPVHEIGQVAKKHRIIFFTDATQAVGKIPVDVQQSGIDLLALTAHKMYGPKGVGALYVRRKNPRVKLTSQLDGGGHEKGMRSGTLNVTGIVGLGKACEIAGAEMEASARKISVLRDRLETALLSLDDTSVSGSIEKRLPHVTNISFGGVNDEALIAGINKEIAVSSGSACSSASIEPSYVLKAIGLSDEMAHSSIRFGLGKSTTEEEINYTIEKVSKTVKSLREMSPAGTIETIIKES
ncbi:MAG TPA: IscS subfamily cysteine desulfurase [Flavisolibacter sp.]